MARIIETVIGHEKEMHNLLQLKSRGRWPHAAIFVGPSGIGKKKVAIAMAQALICQESADGCGQCGRCLRVEKEQSESLIVVEPDTSLARPVIKVEKIRELLDSLSLASLDSARVVIIDQAHTMNPQAANALLKTLEEPSENIFFILIAQDVHQFMPTIRSRSQVVRFSTLTQDQIRRIKPNLSEWMYRGSRGQLDLLKTLSSDEGASKREESFLLLEQFCQDPDFLRDKEWRDTVKDKSWALFVLRCWMQMMRDAMVLKTQAQKFVLNTDQVSRLKLLYTLSNGKISALATGLVEAERELLGNVDVVLIFENMWVKYARVD